MIVYTKETPGENKPHRGFPGSWRSASQPRSDPFASKVRLPL